MRTYTMPRLEESFVSAPHYYQHLDFTPAFLDYGLARRRPLSDDSDEPPPLTTDSDGPPPLADDSDEMPPLTDDDSHP
jgi:hypothetical protein